MELSHELFDQKTQPQTFQFHNPNICYSQTLAIGNFQKYANYNVSLHSPYGLFFSSDLKKILIP